MRDLLIARPLQGFVIPPRIVAGFQLRTPNEEARRSCGTTYIRISKPHSQHIAARCDLLPSLALLYWFSNSGTRDNDGLQLRAISI
jgi:hypothetical protein